MLKRHVFELRLTAAGALRRAAVLSALTFVLVEIAILLRLLYQATSRLPGPGIDGFVYDLAGWLVTPFRGQDTTPPVKETGFLDLPALIAVDAYLFAGLLAFLVLYVLSRLATRFWPRGVLLRVDVTPLARAAAWASARTGAASRRVSAAVAGAFARLADAAGGLQPVRAISALVLLIAGKAQHAFARVADPSALDARWEALCSSLHERWQAAGQRVAMAGRWAWAYAHATYTLLEARAAEAVRHSRVHLARWAKAAVAFAREERDRLLRVLTIVLRKGAIITGDARLVMARFLEEDRQRLDRARDMLRGRKDPASARARALRSLVDSSLKNLGTSATTLREQLDRHFPPAPEEPPQAQVSRRELLRFVFARDNQRQR